MATNIMQKKLLSKEDFFTLPNLKLVQLDSCICLPFDSFSTASKIPHQSVSDTVQYCAIFFGRGLRM